MGKQTIERRKTRRHDGEPRYRRGPTTQLLPGPQPLRHTIADTIANTIAPRAFGSVASSGERSLASITEQAFSLPAPTTSVNEAVSRTLLPLIARALLDRMAQGPLPSPMTLTLQDGE